MIDHLYNRVCIICAVKKIICSREAALQIVMLRRGVHLWFLWCAFGGLRCIYVVQTLISAQVHEINFVKVTKILNKNIISAIEEMGHSSQQAIKTIKIVHGHRAYIVLFVVFAKPPRKFVINHVTAQRVGIKYNNLSTYLL